MSRPYNYGTKSLKANSSANNTFGKVAITTNTTQSNKNQYSKLKNKAYYSLKKGSLKNNTRPKVF